MLSQKRIDELNVEKTKGLKGDLKESAIDANGIHVIIKKVEVPNADVLKQLSFDLNRELEDLVLILGAEIENKPLLSVMFAKTIVDKHQINASEVVRSMAREIQGGGGGQPFYATAGGKNPEGIEKALNLGKDIIEESLKTKV